MPIKNENKNTKSARFNIRGDKKVIDDMQSLANDLGVSASELWIDCARRRLKNSDLDELREAIRSVPEIMSESIANETARILDEVANEVRLMASKHLEIAKAMQSEQRKDMALVVEQAFEMTKRFQQIADLVINTKTQSETTTATKSGGGGSVLNLKDLQTR